MTKKQNRKKQTSGKKANYHDVLFKMCLNNIERAKEFLSLALPKQTLDLFEWKNLREEKTAFLKKELILSSLHHLRIKTHPKSLKMSLELFSHRT